MLEGYFGITSSSEYTPERRKRLLTVPAAVEIAKASVGSSSNSPSSDLYDVAERIDLLANAIQKTLDK